MRARFSRSASSSVGQQFALAQLQSSDKSVVKRKAGVTSTECRKAAWAGVEAMETRHLLSGGALDSTFGTGGLSTFALSSGPSVSAAAIQTDGKIVEVGGLWNGTNSDFALVRFTPSGAADTTFGTGGKVITDFNSVSDAITSVAVQSDGKIVVAGYTTSTILGVQFGSMAIARYNTNGSLDTSFGTGGKVSLGFGTNFAAATNVLLQSNGKIVITGTAYYGLNSDDFAAARLNSDGSLDTSFGVLGETAVNFSGLLLTASDDIANAAALQSDGKILMGGSSNGQYGLARFNTDGSLDTGFNSTGLVVTTLDSGGQSAANSLAIQSSGKIIAAGERDNVAVIERYSSSGAVDTSFGSSGMRTVTGMGGPSGATGVAVQADDKILLTGGGTFNAYTNTFYLERFNTDGTIDTGFGTSGIATCSPEGPDNRQDFETGLAIESDGKVLVIGAQAFYTSFLVNRFTLTSAPTAAAGGSYSVNEGNSITLSGAGSSDPDGETLTYQWDLNYNGTTFNSTASGVSPTFSAASIAGSATRTIALRVVDLLGMPSASLSTATVTINHVNPTITLPSTQTFNEGSAITLAATAIGDNGFHDPFTYRWHVTTSNGQSISDSTNATYPITLQGDGTYTATLTVTDHAGGATSATTTITSTHVNPTVGVSGPSGISRDEWNTFSLSASGPGLTYSYEPITSWSINWGDKKYDGSSYIESFSGNPSSETHMYNAAGTYTVTATATDKDGTYSTTQSVTVAAGVSGDIARAKGIAASTGSTAANAVDGDSSTSWTSTAADSNQWIFVDLGGLYDVNRVKLTWGTNYAATFKLRASSDSMNWRDFTNVTTSSGTVDDLSSVQVIARYIMVQPRTPKSGASSYQLASFEVYGSASLIYNAAHSTNLTMASGGTGATNATDSDGTTQWVSGAGGSQWLFMDMGDASNANTMRVWFGANYGASFHVAVSNDSTHWTNASSEFTGHAGLNEVAIQGSGRYVLLSLDSTASGASNYQVNDVAVYGTNNLATGHSTTASSGTGASLATDTSTSTAWVSATDSTRTTQQYITLDLGDEFDVTRIALNWSGDYASTFTFQISVDNSTYTTAKSFTGGTGAGVDTSVLADARYIRVLCTGYGSTNRFSISDLQVYGSSNLAISRGGFASSYTGTNYGTNTTDEDVSTHWISNGTVNQWLVVDLGATAAVTAVNVNWGTAYAATYQVYSSNDGSNWTLLSSNGTTSFSGQAGGSFVAGLNGTGRYIMIACITPATGQTNFDIANVEIYGHA